MLKKLPIILFFLFGCFPVISQTISGKVVDKVSLKPIQNVAIITNLNRGSTSDNDGKFTLLSKDLESITFSSLGYVTLTIKFDELKKLNYMVFLIEKVNELDEIQLNLAKISLDSILIKTQKSMIKNYVSGALNSRFYSKENSEITFKKLELDLDKSSLLNSINIKNAKNELTDWYNNFISKQAEIINNNKIFTSAGTPNDLTRVFKKRRVVQQKYITYVKSIDDLNSVEILDSICNVAAGTFELLENIADNHKVTNF